MLAGIVNDSCGFDYLPTLDMLGFPPDAVDNALNSEHINKGVYNFIGGEDEALMRIENWMFRDDHLQEYFEIRNGMLGEAYSSKLSPWLAIGCISPRFVIYIHCPLLYS
jgi:deoxyribodipyrimidine photo-lyase